MSLLDIGGGFPGDDTGAVTFEQIAQQVNPTLDNLFPKSIDVIAEPGRFFSHSCGSLATKVISRRFVTEQAKKDAGAEASAPDVYYYIGDGTYGSFNCKIADHYIPEKIECFTDSDKLISSRVFGPTCDGFDTLYDNEMLPLMEIGDMMFFRNMGAYTTAAASNFNGINSPEITYVKTTN